MARSRKSTVGDLEPPTALKREVREVIFEIEYRVEPENIELVEVLDKMRETGKARVLRVRVAE